MSKRGVLAGALCGALSLPLLAQEAPPKAEQGSVEQIQRLIEQLGAESYQERKAAEKALRGLGSPAEGALGQAADEHPDPEVRWRARRLLRSQAEPAPRGLKRRSEGEPVRRARTRDRTEPRRLFGEDELPFGRLRIQGLEDLEQQLEEMRARMDDLRSQFESGGTLIEMGEGLGESTNLQIGPDGVRLELKSKGEDGATDTEVFEAPDVETFREKYPEQAEQYLGQGGAPGDAFAMPRLQIRGLGEDFPRLRLSPGESRTFRLNPGGQLRLMEPPQAMANPLPAGPRLGIFIQPLAPEVGEFLGLEPGQGLSVREVQEGSLADAIDIQPRDVVLQIDERKIFGVADVAEALREAGSGNEVTVLVSRRGAQLELRGTVPEIEVEGADVAPPPAPAQPKKLRRVR